MEDDQIESAPEADLEVVQPDEGQEASADAAEVAPDEEKTRTQKRRDRERAARERAATAIADARREAAEAKAKLDRILRADATDKRPSADEYPDPIEHAAKLGAWEVLNAQRAPAKGEAQAALAEAEAKEAQAAQAARDAIMQDWYVQSNEARTRYADFDAVVNAAPLKDDLSFAIAESEVAGDLAYEICRNPNLVSRLNTMNAVQMAREIGRIEASLTAPRPRTATKAPDPISPVRGNAGTRDPSKMTPAEYREWRANGGTY